jgi:uncharacterized protein YceK
MIKSIRRFIMNKKLFYVAVFLIFILFLSGCGSGISTSEKDLVKGVVYEYYLALSNENWSKAQNYCVYGSDAYYVVEHLKNLFNTTQAICPGTIMDYYVVISNASINGNYAEVDCTVTLLITGCGDTESRDDAETMTLQKIDTWWKIY